MESLPDSKTDLFFKLAATITPEVASLDPDGRFRMFAIVDTALMDRAPSVRRQFETFISLISVAPVVRYGRTFDRLDAGRRRKVLSWFEGCPIGLLRKGFWGLKALVFMGFYGQSECSGGIGYAPRFDGRAGLRRDPV